MPIYYQLIVSTNHIQIDRFKENLRNHFLLLLLFLLMLFLLLLLLLLLLPKKLNNFVTAYRNVANKPLMLHISLQEQQLELEKLGPAQISLS